MDLKVTIYKYEGEGKVKAGASVVIDDAIIVKGFTIVEGKNGLFVAMPSKPKKSKGEVVKEDGKTVYVDTTHPITKEGREALVGAILEAYKNA